MLELIAQKSESSEVSVNLARQYLNRHEWGQARLLLQEALEKARPGDLILIHSMLEDISDRLGIANSNVRQIEYRGTAQRWIVLVSRTAVIPASSGRAQRSIT